MMGPPEVASRWPQPIERSRTSFSQGNERRCCRRVVPDRDGPDIDCSSSSSCFRCYRGGSRRHRLSEGGPATLRVFTLQPLCPVDGSAHPCSLLPRLSCRSRQGPVFRLLVHIRVPITIRPSTGEKNEAFIQCCAVSAERMLGPPSLSGRPPLERIGRFYTLIRAR